MKKLFLILAMIVSVMLLACSPKDEDENNNSNGDNDNNIITGTINGHDWIDLGLPSGLKWATCNIGANKPEEYGDYFAWAEISPKESYTEYNYQHWADANGNGYWDVGELTVNIDISGTQYDAATNNWGESWRMPTIDEMQELIDHCRWVRTQVNNIRGVKVIGPNGGSIFLPAASFRYGSSLYDAGSYGNYWSSTPYYDYYGISANRIIFSIDDSSGSDFEYLDALDRFLGYTVRPISE